MMQKCSGRYERFYLIRPLEVGQTVPYTDRPRRGRMVHGTVIRRVHDTSSEYEVRTHDEPMNVDESRIRLCRDDGADALLRAAAHEGDVAVVDLLLKNGVDVHEATSEATPRCTAPPLTRATSTLSCKRLMDAGNRAS